MLKAGRTEDEMKALSVIWTVALAMTPALASAQAAPDGVVIYKQRCQVCHGAANAKASPLGPSLAGVVGRPAASKPFAYSTALKASKLTWTKPNLDKFLAGPSKMVPGTKMVMAVPDGAQRAALIGYLAKLK